ncbi:myelin-associated oligodendrocyte basic protein-like [Vidua chalybeata]|uniref:myelin-associated oligodendrocyte basic protein-like n=1 Tax=Vidua chalybeata TaxID=81927 RepID=UPI0023A89742|nr:myelin-associated oligodendrocyte basic protein-like [Vidua chalybeata]
MAAARGSARSCCRRRSPPAFEHQTLRTPPRAPTRPPRQVRNPRIPPRVPPPSPRQVRDRPDAPSGSDPPAPAGVLSQYRQRVSDANQRLCSVCTHTLCRDMDGTPRTPSQENPIPTNSCPMQR